MGSFSNLHFSGDCVKFLTRQAKELDLPVVVYELVPKKPVVVMTWEGTQPELPAILLNSHMDVVPVYEVQITIQYPSVTYFITTPFHHFIIGVVLKS